MLMRQTSDKHIVLVVNHEQAATLAATIDWVCRVEPTALAVPILQQMKPVMTRFSEANHHDRLVGILDDDLIRHPEEAKDGD